MKKRKEKCEPEARIIVQPKFIIGVVPAEPPKIDVNLSPGSIYYTCQKTLTLDEARAVFQALGEAILEAGGDPHDSDR